MKKLLFSLMFLSGLLLFTSCQEEDPRDNLPQFGENKLAWLKDGAEFIYTTNTGDSLLMRYELVGSPNIFKKIVVPFSTGDSIADSLVMKRLYSSALMSYVQPGLNNKKPSLWESNNNRMTNREEIYKFDESFRGKEWHFTINQVKNLNWTNSTEAGQYSLLNTRTIVDYNAFMWYIKEINEKGEEVLVDRIHATQIALTSKWSDNMGIGTSTIYTSYCFVNQKDGLLKGIDSDFFEYTLYRKTANTVVLPQLPAIPGLNVNNFIAGKINDVDYYEWATAVTVNGEFGETITISNIVGVPTLSVSFPSNITEGTHQITGAPGECTGSYSATREASATETATAGTITITSITDKVVKGTFEFTTATANITVGEFSAELP